MVSALLRGVHDSVRKLVNLVRTNYPSIDQMQECWLRRILNHECKGERDFRFSGFTLDMAHQEPPLTNRVQSRIAEERIAGNRPQVRDGAIRGDHENQLDHAFGVLESGLSGIGGLNKMCRQAAQFILGDVDPRNCGFRRSFPGWSLRTKNAG